MNNKKIAVFIPCYNAAQTIGATLDSVKKSIQQIGFEVPVYIYDDCSKDDAVSIAQSTWNNPGLIIRKNNENVGERKTTNNAFDYFNGKYDWVFIIHADDLVKPEWLSSLYANIQKAEDKTCFTVWSSFDSLDNETGKVTPGDNSGETHIRKRTEPEIIYYISKLYSNWHISGAAFNVSLFQQLNGFDVSMAQFGDTDFFVRGLLAGYDDVYISRTLTFYRTFPGSVSAVSSKTNRDIREIYMLLEKFDTVLSPDDRKKMYQVIQRLSLRRMIKSLSSLQLRLSIDNGRIFLRSTGQKLGFKIK